MIIVLQQCIFESTSEECVATLEEYVKLRLPEKLRHLPAVGKNPRLP